MERTRHRAERKHFVVHHFVADYEHAVAVMIPMPAQFVKIALCHERRFGEHVPSALFFVLDETLHGLHYLCALRHEQRQALPDALFGHEQTEIATELVMIALFRFGEFSEILLDFRLLFKRHAVNTGEHFIVLVALPIRARYLNELYVLDLARAREMRSFAKIDKAALLVHGNLRAARQLLDELHFVHLVKSAHLRHSRLARNNKPLYGQVGGDYLVHFVFDRSKIVHSDSERHIYVVVKPDVCRRTDRKLCGGINVFYRLRENMRRRVTVRRYAVGIAVREDLERTIVLEFISKIHKLAVDLGYERGAGKPFAYPARYFLRRYSDLGFDNVSVFECDVHCQ